MAKQTLPINFVDDILAQPMGGKRKFAITDNGDGTYSIEDVTEYTQIGSDFGASQMNQTNQAVNDSCDKADVIDDSDDILANQANGKIAGAKAVAKLIRGKVNGWDNLEAVPNPYTPDVDGLIRIYFSPSGNTNATVYATQNGTSHFSATSSGGANIAQFFPALAGHTYQGQASQPGTIQLAFMALRTE